MVDEPARVHRVVRVRSFGLEGAGSKASQIPIGKAGVGN